MEAQDNSQFPKGTISMIRDKDLTNKVSLEMAKEAWTKECQQALGLGKGEKVCLRTLRKEAALPTFIFSDFLP